MFIKSQAIINLCSSLQSNSIWFWFNQIPCTATNESSYKIQAMGACIMLQSSKINQYNLINHFVDPQNLWPVKIAEILAIIVIRSILPVRVSIQKSISTFGGLLKILDLAIATGIANKLELVSVLSQITIFRAVSIKEYSIIWIILFSFYYAYAYVIILIGPNCFA